MRHSITWTYKQITPKHGVIRIDGINWEFDISDMANPFSKDWHYVKDLENRAYWNEYAAAGKSSHAL